MAPLVKTLLAHALAALFGGALLVALMVWLK